MNPEQLLAEYLGYSSPEEICVDQYLIYSDDDATEACGDMIRENLWSFNPAFLAKHMKGLMDERNVDKVAYSMYEDANPVFLRLIEDIDAFIDDAIQADGRGHFLAHYDGEELEIGTIDGVDYYAYKVN